MDFDKLDYRSKIAGVGGRIKDTAEAFIVQEIWPNGITYKIDENLEKSRTTEKFLHIVLQKKDWTTEQAVAELAKVMGVSDKRFSWSGTKDRKAITTQLISGYKLDERAIERLEKANLKDIKVLGYWGAKEMIRQGDHLGNAFKIMIKDTDDGAEGRIAEIFADLNGAAPNYFGPQRFGSRGNNHVIGKRILQGNFYEAVIQFLTGHSEDEPEEGARARKELREWKDFGKALEDFPRSLKYERKMLEHLVSKPGDFVGAIRAVHRSVSLRFVHAYQSYLFNLLLSRNLHDLTAHHDWPTASLIGYDTTLNEQEKHLLDEEGIAKEDFKIRSMPELSSKGSLRPMIVPIKNFSYSDSIFSFELPKGAYATSVLREFTDRKENINPQEIFLHG
jgi:tRNA pseudouridine13 synthase